MSKGKEQQAPVIAAPASERPMLRFKHLKARGICENRQRLKVLVERHGFPPGIYTGPNTRMWFPDEIDAWLKARPIERPAALKATVDPAKARG
jgi:hypothetical protein